MNKNLSLLLLFYNVNLSVDALKIFRNLIIAKPNTVELIF